MAVLNYSTLVANTTNFTPGQDTKILISTAYNRGDSLPAQSFTLGTLATDTAGSGATATVTVTGGAITAIQITAGGSGYINGASIAFTGTGGTGAAATLLVVGGVVTGYVITAPGSGYPSSGTTAAITPFTNASGAVAIGATEITLSAPLTVALYEGTRLPFNDAGIIKPVYVAAYAPVGAQGIFILPAKTAIATGAIATINAWIPLFSANQVSLEQSASVIAEQNFSAGLDTQKAVTQLDGKANTQGIQVYQDPGLAILNAAVLNAQLVHVTVLKGSQRGGHDFEAVIAGLPESIQKNQYIQQTCNLDRSGTISYFDY
jgi:hypothetical protein